MKHKMTIFFSVFLLLFATSLAVVAQDDDAAEPRAYIASPTDNAKVPNSFTIILHTNGLEALPAGDSEDGAGYFNILIDTPFVEAGEVIEASDLVIPLVGGETEYEIEFEGGSHTIRSQFTDGEGVALEGEQYQDEIHVGVYADAPEKGIRFVMPTDGAIVPEDVQVMMSATGLIVEPSGTVHENAGHFHILVDTPFVEAGEEIPADESHLHFGGGQTETTVTLEPGEHTLRLQMADGEHIALEGDEYRDEINVTVEEGAPAQSIRFVTPQNGAIVPAGEVELKWAANGLIVEPAGQVLRDGDGGHFHVLIDTDFIPAGEVIPNDETHVHFGSGVLGGTIEFPAGAFNLRLQMANGAHIAFDGDQFHDQMTIIVTPAEE